MYVGNIVAVYDCLVSGYRRFLNTVLDRTPVTVELIEILKAVLPCSITVGFYRLACILLSVCIKNYSDAFRTDPVFIVHIVPDLHTGYGDLLSNRTFFLLRRMLIDNAVSVYYGLVSFNLLFRDSILVLIAFRIRLRISGEHPAPAITFADILASDDLSVSHQVDRDDLRSDSILIIPVIPDASASDAYSLGHRYWCYRHIRDRRYCYSRLRRYGQLRCIGYGRLRRYGQLRCVSYGRLRCYGQFRSIGYGRLRRYGQFRCIGHGRLRCYGQYWCYDRFRRRYMGVGDVPAVDDSCVSINCSFTDRVLYRSSVRIVLFKILEAVLPVSCRTNFLTAFFLSVCIQYYCDTLRTNSILVIRVIPVFRT